jgi:hypothetical protein
MIFWDIIFPGVATGLCLVSALGCRLHERGRGWPLFSFRGADDLQPIRVTYMSRGNETRIRSGHHVQSDLCLACLRSAPRLCTLTSPRRWAYVPEPLRYLPWRGCMTAPRFGTLMQPSRERSRLVTVRSSGFVVTFWIGAGITSRVTCPWRA